MKELESQSSPKTSVLLSAAALVFVAAISILLFVFRDALQSFARFGYLGIFLTSLLINLTLVMPLPTGILTSAMGAVYNPFLVGLAAGTGAALGELSGYLAGYSGRKIISQSSGGSKVEEQVRKYGGWGIMVLALIPNPAFDIVGIAAGAMKIPVWKFLFWCWLGKVLKMLAFAYLGDVIKLPWDPLALLSTQQIF